MHIFPKDVLGIKDLHMTKEAILGISEKIWQNKLLGIIITITSNILFIYEWRKKAGFFYLCLFFLFYYLLITLILRKIVFQEVKKIEEEKEEDKLVKDDFALYIKKRKDTLVNFIRDVTSWEEPSFTVVVLIEVFIFMKIFYFVGDKFICLLLLNFVIFYHPIEHKKPYFAYCLFMEAYQIIQGIVGICECLIPRYEEPKVAKV